MTTDTLLGRQPLYTVQSYIDFGVTSDDGNAPFVPDIHHQLAVTLNRITDYNVRSLQVLERHGRVVFVVVEFLGVKNNIYSVTPTTLEDTLKITLQNFLDQNRRQRRTEPRGQLMPAPQQTAVERADPQDVVDLFSVTDRANQILDNAEAMYIDPVMPLILGDVPQRIESMLRKYYQAIVAWEPDWSIKSHEKWNQQMKLWQMAIVTMAREAGFLAGPEIDALSHYLQLSKTHPQLVRISDEESSSLFVSG